MAESAPTQPTLSTDQQEKLRELTAQSWNLELVISGAALFAVLQLPDLLDQAFDYFRYNFMTSMAGAQGMLPLLAYSLMKAMCYVLFLAFLTNFVMRAFWVGLVGLLAVYPTGIHYDRIPFSTPYAQKRMATDLGPLDRYILRLDQRCNIIFAVAFLFVIFLIVVALSYVIILLISAIVRPMIPPDIRHIIELSAYALFILYFITSIVLSLPTVKAHPTGERLHYQLTSVGKLVYWGMYPPFGFLVNTFFSHLPFKKIVRAMGLFMVLFIVVIVVELLANMSRVDRRISFNQRHLYSARLDSLFSNPNTYDDQLPDGEYVSAAAIQSDVIREPFIRLFVAYPKALDTLLTQLAKEPVWNDTLPRKEIRRRFAEWSHGQMSNLMHITVNDSVYRRPDLLFTQRGSQQQRGWKTVLIPANLKTGKNTIRISLKPDSLAKPQEITTIPFWYVPDK
ncbi:hypothetical protein [Spirosoma utsteinense]|uniref:Uncharacterized protein n=1 Tax=Spirosoma utsteinense TaxID=2585773 RepID=A0ABR6WBV5_9BACT|nr:hypothetical protein [Spirosoma utsteinense]MBC3784225.1 hypothetical protein [Spirosoma utsteinense]MBC3793988.1 hypothetical protein [Spirosoma utsteinense]